MFDVSCTTYIVRQLKGRAKTGQQNADTLNDTIVHCKCRRMQRGLRMGETHVRNVGRPKRGGETRTYGNVTSLRWIV